MNTEDNTVLESNNIENAYSLIKQLKNEMTQNTVSEEIINDVSEIMEGTVTNEQANDTKSDETEKSEEKKVLIISSRENKVILPYKEANINVLLEDGIYSSREEAIEKRYTIPLSKYKNEALSRVVEGYKLARVKEEKSVVDSLKYALNLLFERRLHPAIITACDTIDELDIYLACLEENVMELFDFFDVVFDYAPIKVIGNHVK